MKKRGFKVRWMTSGKRPADIARHVIGCRLSQETRVQMRFGDVASNVYQALICGVVRGAVAGGRGAEVGAGAARGGRGDWRGGAGADSGGNGVFDAGPLGGCRHSRAWQMLLVTSAIRT